MGKLGRGPRHAPHPGWGPARGSGGLPQPDHEDSGNCKRVSPYDVLLWEFLITFRSVLPQLSSQAELEMALRSQMEIIADSPRGVGTVHFGPMPPASGRSSSVSRVRSVEHLKQQACAAKPSRREDAPHDEGSGSDGECHGEDDEVRSLSLSEDGPVIRRSVSQGSTARVAATALNMIAKRGAAPDPIAMLTDGTRKASSRATAGDDRASADLRWSGDGWLVGEQLSGEVSCVE